MFEFQKFNDVLQDHSYCDFTKGDEVYGESGNQEFEQESEGFNIVLNLSNSYCEMISTWL